MFTYGGDIGWGVRCGTSWCDLDLTFYLVVVPLTCVGYISEAIISPARLQNLHCGKRVFILFHPVYIMVIQCPQAMALKLEILRREGSGTTSHHKCFASGNTVDLSQYDPGC